MLSSLLLALSPHFTKFALQILTDLKALQKCFPGIYKWLEGHSVHRACLQWSADVLIIAWVMDCLPPMESTIAKPLPSAGKD